MAINDLPINPAFKRFLCKPMDCDSVTMVTCIHPDFRNGILYFRLEEYQEWFMPVTATLWVNDYIFHIQTTNT